jgi:hypothetical protein
MKAPNENYCFDPLCTKLSMNDDTQYFLGRDVSVRFFLPTETEQLTRSFRRRVPRNVRYKYILHPLIITTWPYISTASRLDKRWQNMRMIVNESNLEEL